MIVDRPRGGVARAASIAVCAAALLVPGIARAQAAPQADTGVTAPAPKLVEVRLALSPAALKQISEPRLRRLLEIELGDSAVLAPAPTGPLGDHVAYVWVDLVGPETVAIEVRVGTRAVEHRDISDAELTGDLAARVIAIAAAEMVRDQMKPIRAPKKPPAPKPPTPEEIEAASRKVDAVTVDARAATAIVPSVSATLFGPSVDVGFRRFGVGAHLLGAFFTGPTSFGSARWFEVGLAGSYRQWVTPSLRFAGELSATAAAVRIAGARLAEEPGDAQDTWSTRAGGSLAIEWRVAEPMWLTLGVNPSVVLRPFDVTVSGARAPFEGFFLGAALGVLFEQRAPVHLKALQSTGVP
ncbi:MAG: hypothetical protein U0441_19640 [Polyangiaceae bacterium]